jgi:PKD repeat protein
VQIAADPRSGNAPLGVRFTSNASDPDGDALMYVWEFGDGSSAGGPSATHTYAQVGTYTAKLTVTDSRGASASATVIVTVSAAAAPPLAKGGVAGAVSSVRVPKSMAKFRRNGVRVTLSCADDARGTASLKVTRSVAKRLGLKSRTLSSQKVRCTTGRTLTVRLKPTRAASKRLAARGTRTLKMTLRVAVKGEQTVKRSLTVS